MRMSSLKDWCKNQQDMFEQTKLHAKASTQKERIAIMSAELRQQAADGHGDFKDASGGRRLD